MGTFRVSMAGVNGPARGVEDGSFLVEEGGCKEET